MRLLFSLGLCSALLLHCSCKTAPEPNPVAKARCDDKPWKEENGVRMWLSDQPPCSLFAVLAKETLVPDAVESSGQQQVQLEFGAQYRQPATARANVLRADGVIFEIEFQERPFLSPVPGLVPRMTGNASFIKFSAREK
jgi:hypothetical protein